MASFADLRPLIIVATFLSVFLFLTTLIYTQSPQFMAGSTQGQVINPNSNFAGYSLIAWNVTNGTSVHGSNGWTYDAKLGGQNIKIYYYDIAGTQYIQVDTYDTVDLWLFSYQTNFEHLCWYNGTGTTEPIRTDVIGGGGPYYIRMDFLDDCYAAGISLTYTISNSRVTSLTGFSFNTTLYTSPSDAVSHNELIISFNNDYAERPTALNAFSIIMGLLFWNLPGVPTEIYLLISVPMWIGMIYIAAIWVLRLVGAIFGGGASG